MGLRHRCAADVLLSRCMKSIFNSLAVPNVKKLNVSFD